MSAASGMEETDMVGSQVGAATGAATEAATEPATGPAAGFLALADMIEEVDDERSGFFSEMAVCLNSFRASAVSGSSEVVRGGVGLRLCGRSAIITRGTTI